jgi:enoyl-CoA hydratase
VKSLTPKLLMDLHMTLKEFAKNDGIRCVVIRGSGDKVFSSGYDITAIPVTPVHDMKQKTPDILIHALDTLKNFPYPTIAMLNGHAFGAGFNLCACCDIRLAAEDIKMGMTPARLGVAYHPEGIQQFIEAFGMAVTKEIFYTADIFKGKALLRKGLVNHMIPRCDLETFTHSYAQKITQNAPLSLKGIKKVIAMFEKDMALPSSNLQEADQIMQQCFQSDDLKEGQIAFMEKRIPKFTGK